MVLQNSYFLITKTLILVIIFFAAHTFTIFWAGLYDEAIAPYYQPAITMAHILAPAVSPKNIKIFQISK